MTLTTPARPLTRASAARAALGGLVAGLVTVGVATLLAAIMVQIGAAGGQPAPVAAVAAEFIDRTPPWLKDFAVSAFGTADKLVLLLGIVVVLAGLCAAIGILALRRLEVGLVAFALLGLVAVAAVLGRPGASAADVAPTLAGALAGLVFLSRVTADTPALQVDRSQPPDPAPSDDVPGPSRRLVIGAAVGGGATVGGWALAGATSGAAESRQAVPALTVARRVRVPAGAQLPVPGLTPFVVPNTDFYRIDTAFVVPRLDAREWRLRVWGQVEREVEIDWATLSGKQMREAMVTLTCVSNEVGGDLVGNAVWTGWPVRELLAAAGPKPGADMVLQRSSDGWTCGTPLTALTDDRDALLAVRMNGEPLPFEHGFPVRVVVPGLYGYVSACKWVTELKVTSFAEDQGYWTPRGWSARGPIKTASRIDVPRAGDTVPAGRVVLAGVAWAQHRGIGRVEVRVDDDPWQEATLAEEPTIDAWRQWRHVWQAQSGSHEVQVRATDGTGAVQSDRRRPPAPDGAEGLHTITVRVE